MATPPAPLVRTQPEPRSIFSATSSLLLTSKFDTANNSWVYAGKTLLATSVHLLGTIARSFASFLYFRNCTITPSPHPSACRHRPLLVPLQQHRRPSHLWISRTWAFRLSRFWKHTLQIASLRGAPECRQQCHQSVSVHSSSSKPSWSPWYCLVSTVHMPRRGSTHLLNCKTCVRMDIQIWHCLNAVSPSKETLERSERQADNH